MAQHIVRRKNLALFKNLGKLLGSLAVNPLIAEHFDKIGSHHAPQQVAFGIHRVITQPESRIGTIIGIRILRQARSLDLGTARKPRKNLALGFGLFFRIATQVGVKIRRFVGQFVESQQISMIDIESSRKHILRVGHIKIIDHIPHHHRDNQKLHGEPYICAPFIAQLCEKFS